MYSKLLLNTIGVLNVCAASATLSLCSRMRISQPTTWLSKFVGNERGNFAIMFALLTVPMISAVGMAVDLSSAYRVTSHTQNALDSAVLAAGRAGQTNATNTLSAAQTAATNFFNAAKPTSVLSSTIALTADSTNTTFTLTATTWVSTPFLGILSWMFSGSAPSGAPASCSTAYACVKIARTATASIGAGGNGGSNVEVSLMLDVTGSMDGTKLTTLKDAASDLVDTIIWTDQSRYTSRMAIVPFAENVNVGDYYAAVTGTPASTSTCTRTRRGVCTRWRTSSYDTCVVDRTTNSGTDTAPAVGSWVPSAYSSSCTPGVSIVPLTSNKDTLKGVIDDLDADGGTAGALGTQWTWFVISPRWASIWGTASAPGAYADLTTLNSNGAPRLKKFAVLMTDGDYNVMSGANAWASTVNTAALANCSGMKTAGIIVYTVGFQVSSAAKTMLTSCASSSDKFYDATSNEALVAAFRDIALKISSLRLTN